MTPLTLLSIAASIFLLSLIVVIFNFLRIAKNPSEMLEEGSLFGSFGTHIIAGAVASLSMLTLVGSFIWFLVERYATHGG